MNITPLYIFILISATWRLASLFANEPGPFKIFKRFRNLCERLHNDHRWFYNTALYHGLLCEWCNSIWFGTLLVASWYFLGDVIVIVALPLALSAWAIVLKYIVQTLEQAREYVEHLNGGSHE